MWSQQTIDCIWWRIHHQALMKYGYLELLTIRKFNLDCWAMRQRDHEFYKLKPAHCQCCYETTETKDHIVRCSNRSRNMIRLQWIDQLFQFLSELHTPRGVRFTILLLRENMDGIRDKDVALTHQPDIKKGDCGTGGDWMETFPERKAINFTGVTN
jgi:hypothetical protein